MKKLFASGIAVKSEEQVIGSEPGQDDPRRRPMSYLWILGLAAFAVLAAGANFFYHFADWNSKPIDAVNPSEESQPVPCFGFVDVEYGVRSLYPVQPGRVVDVPVHEGDHVKKGQVLLRLDDTFARAKMLEAQADFDAAKAQLVQARRSPEQHDFKVDQQKAAIEAVERRLAAAEHALKRKQELLKVKQINQEEVDAAAEQVKELEAVLRAERAKLQELELANPKVMVDRAEADVAAKSARVEQAKRGLEECKILAPDDGTVQRILVGPGDVLGDQPKQPAILFSSDGPRFIRAEVAQEFANRVHLGEPARILDDARLSTTEWRGKVKRISDWYTHRRSIIYEPLQHNDIRTLECIIEVEPDQPPLRIGQRMRVTIGNNP